MFTPELISKMKWNAERHYQAALRDLAEEEMTTDRRKLEKEFDKAMLAIYTRPKEEAGYHAPRFFRLLQESPQPRGVNAARSLLRAGGPQDGFFRLHQLGRLDLSVEVLVLEPKWQPFFSEMELGEARKRLRLVHYTVAA